jgi:Ca2+-binding RTX toxin-like protein
VNLNGGAGNDQIVVGSASNTLDTIDAVFVNGGDDFDTLIVNDQGSTTVSHTYTEKPFLFDRSGVGEPNATVFFKADVELPLLNKGLVAGSAPMVTDLALTESIKAGQSATLSGLLVDADAADKLTLTVDWGDGSKPQVSEPGREPFSLKHKYKKPGTYTVHVTWADSTGLSNSRDLTLTVQAKNGK